MGIRVITMSEIKRYTISPTLYKNLQKIDTNNDGKISGSQELSALKSQKQGFGVSPQDHQFLQNITSNFSSEIDYAPTSATATVAFVDETPPLALSAHLNDVRGNLNLQIEDINGFNDRGKNDLSGKLNGSVTFNHALFDKAFQDMVDPDADPAINHTGFDSSKKAYYINITASAAWIFSDNFNVYIQTDDQGRLYMELKDNWFGDAAILENLESKVKNSLKGINMKLEKDGNKMYLLPELQSFKVPLDENNQPSIDKIDSTTDNTRMRIDSDGNVIMTMTNVDIAGSSASNDSGRDRAKDTANLNVRFGMDLDSDFNLHRQEYLVTGRVDMDIESGEMPDLGADSNTFLEQHLGRTGKINVRNVESKISYDGNDQSWNTEVRDTKLNIRADSGATASMDLYGSSVNMDKNNKISSSFTHAGNLELKAQDGSILSADMVTVEGELGKDAEMKVFGMTAKGTIAEVEVDAEAIDATIRQTASGTTIRVIDGQLNQFKNDRLTVEDGTFDGTIKLNKDYDPSSIKINVHDIDSRYRTKDVQVSAHAKSGTIEGTDSKNLDISFADSNIHSMVIKGEVHKARGFAKGTNLTMANGKLKAVSVSGFRASELNVEFDGHEMDLTGVRGASYSMTDFGKDKSFSMTSATLGRYEKDGIANLTGNIANFRGQIQGENTSLSGDVSDINGHIQSSTGRVSMDLENANAHVDFKNDTVRFELGESQVKNVNYENKVTNGAGSVEKGVFEVDTDGNILNIDLDGLNDLSGHVNIDGNQSDVKNGQDGKFKMGADGAATFSLQEADATFDNTKNISASARITNLSGTRGADGESLNVEADFADGDVNASTTDGQSNAELSELNGHINIERTATGNTFDVDVHSAKVEDVTHKLETGSLHAEEGQVSDSKVKFDTNGNIHYMDVNVTGGKGTGSFGDFTTEYQGIDGKLKQDESSYTLTANSGDVTLNQGENKEAEVKGIKRAELQINEDGIQHFEVEAKEASGLDSDHNLEVAGTHVTVTGNTESIHVEGQTTSLDAGSHKVKGQGVKAEIQLPQKEGDILSYSGTADVIDVNTNQADATLYDNRFEGDTTQADINSQRGDIHSKDALKMNINSGEMDTRVTLGENMDLRTVSKEGSIDFLTSGLREAFKTTPGFMKVLDYIEDKKIEGTYRNLTVGGIQENADGGDAMPKHISVDLHFPEIESTLGDAELTTRLYKNDDVFQQSGQLTITPDQRFYSTVETFLKDEYGIQVNGQLKLENGQLVIEGDRGIVHDLGMSIALKGDKMEVNIDEAKALLFFSVRGKVANHIAELLDESLIQYDRPNRRKLSISLNDVIPSDSFNLKSAQITRDNQIKLDFSVTDHDGFDTSAAVRRRFQARLERTLLRGDDKGDIEDRAENLEPDTLREVFQKAHPNQLHKMLWAVGNDYDNLVRDAIKKEVFNAEETWMPLQKYPVENRAIMASYLANNDGFLEKVSDNEEFLVVSLLYSLKSGQGDDFVKWLNPYELERIMDNIPDHGKREEAYGSIQNLYKKTESPFRRLQILQAIAKGMGKNEQQWALHYIRQVETNSHVFDLAKQQKWYSDIHPKARPYLQ